MKEAYMSPLVVVLDACVLYPAALRDTLLTAAETELYEPQWSDMLLEELSRNLILNAASTVHQVQHLLTVMQETFPEAMVIEDYRSLIDSMTNHPKDRHVLAAAVASHATSIVTFNRKDFPASSLEPWGITLQTPDEFLLMLLHRNVEGIQVSLAAQANALHNPPKTMDEVLTTLSLHAPNFVSHLRNMAAA
jgi:predicted nucleic acid-binding protein